MPNNSELVAKLNMMLEQEHACAIRYATHAAVITGPSSESIRARLHEISADEIAHAIKLRDRIVTLGGKPSMRIATEDLQEAYDLETILKINILEETSAIKSYTEILAMVPESNVILHQTLLDIIRDEQEHLEELTNLK